MSPSPDGASSRSAASKFLLVLGQRKKVSPLLLRLETLSVDDIGPAILEQHEHAVIRHRPRHTGNTGRTEHVRDTLARQRAPATEKRRHSARATSTATAAGIRSATTTAHSTAPLPRSGSNPVRASIQSRQTTVKEARPPPSNATVTAIQKRPGTGERLMVSTLKRPETTVKAAGIKPGDYDATGRA